jgi:hypothetical protein
MFGGLHGRKTSLDALANHQEVIGTSTADGATATGTEHHFHGLDRRFPEDFMGKKCAMDPYGFVILASRDKGHYRRPDATGGMLQPCMKAQRR